MPVKNCKVKGLSGKKFGDTGKCYTGKNAETKAKAQGRAIKAQQTKKEKESK